MNLTTNPKMVNDEHFSSEGFPNIIGFCERDNLSHIRNADGETYSYKLHDKQVYTVKKNRGRWEIVEFEGKEIVRVSSNHSLETVLMRALTFLPNDKPNDQKVNILFPVNKIDMERAQAIMYYLGGYPRSFFPQTAEFLFVKDKFIDPELEFLAYSYVPVEYVSWLREELKKTGLTGQNKNRTVWVYRK